VSKRSNRYILATLGTAALLTTMVSAAAEPSSTTAEPSSTTAEPSSTTAEPSSTTEASSSTTEEPISVTVEQCTDCHDDTVYLSSKRYGWLHSGHGEGDVWAERGSSAGCAGCHSGSGFSEAVSLGHLNPDQYAEYLDTNDMSPPPTTPQDCRACHQVHVTYTAADFALETADAVPLYAVNPQQTGEAYEFDKGLGNLCANCHQPRRDFPAADSSGMITGISTHWGPHHGPQSAMLLGLAGSIPAGASGHYKVTQDGCVDCHMGPSSSHTMEVDYSVCETCHFDNFDPQTPMSKIEERLDILGAELEKLGLIDENSPDGHPAVTSAPFAQAGALWNWLYLAHEDKSRGAHNPYYADLLLNTSCAALGITCQ